MGEYYARFFREVRRQVFIFWKAQVAVSISAGFIAAVTNAIREQTPFSVAVWSVSIAVIGYLVVLGLASIGAVMLAPVNLDRQRIDEIRRQREDGERQIAFHRDDSREQCIGRLKAESALEQERARKHPHDEHLSRTIGEALQKLDPHEREFIRHLLDVHKMNNADIHNAGFNRVPNMILGKTGGLLLHFVPYCPGNGLIEMDRTYSINPETQDAIKNILYPLRPVTPTPGP